MHLRHRQLTRERSGSHGKLGGHQWGNFVDPADTIIFTDTYASESWTGTAHVFAGADLPLGPRFVLSAEARYTWATTPLGPDFSGFGDMDLSGLSVTVGVGVRF